MPENREQHTSPKSTCEHDCALVPHQLRPMERGGRVFSPALETLRTTLRIFATTPLVPCQLLSLRALTQYPVRQPPMIIDDPVSTNHTLCKKIPSRFPFSPTLHKDRRGPLRGFSGLQVSDLLPRSEASSRASAEPALLQRAADHQL